MWTDWGLGVHRFQVGILMGSLQEWLPGWVVLGYPSRLRMTQDDASTGAGPVGRNPGQGYSRGPLLPQGMRWPMSLREQWGWKRFPRHVMMADCLSFPYVTEEELRLREKKLFVQDGGGEGCGQAHLGSRPCWLIW